MLCHKRTYECVHRQRRTFSTRCDIVVTPGVEKVLVWENASLKVDHLLNEQSESVEDSIDSHTSVKPQSLICCVTRQYGILIVRR